MWTYNKVLEYPIKIRCKNPRLAKYIISQYGGPDGELAASLRYLSQRFGMPDEKAKAILNDIGTEELAHLEMVGTIVHQLTDGVCPAELEKAGLGSYYTDHGWGVYPQAAAGFPFTASVLAVKGDPIADLQEDLAAEQKARATYEKLIDLCADNPDVLDPLRFLREREVVHFQRFGEALRGVQEKLAEKNPDCNVYIYEIPRIPTSKEDVHYGDGNTECCTFTHLKGSSEAVRFYEGVKVRAQGTSSMTYGISAYNLDSKFPEKWSLDDEAIPVNYFNTKVNVASCEGANNALNQEWYDRYQPYKTQKRLQARTDGKKARDTMEFKNGVVFIKDNNKTTNSDTATANNVFKEIPGYVNNPYPRMYSIGNMGNSKKNTAVFHGAGNIYECCVENADNNTDGQRMVTIGGFYPENKELGVEEHEIGLNLSDDLFDENGFVKPDVEDWGKTFDPILASNPNFSEEECWLDNKTLWRNSLIEEGLFEFRYCIDEDDFEPTAEFSDFDSYAWELSNRFLRLVRWFAKNNPSQATNETFETPIKLPAYTIKGIKATAYDNYPSDSEILKGVSFPEQEFTKDTAEYRVAKMLRESENYLILDSILYHYLFIERHTMVDNVAKNTFWNTEDGIHWELTKDYDNDTADGVNNSGNLVFDYGAEVMDDTINGTAIFNARPSAWLHFAHGLRPLREKMYQTLGARGAWNYEPYLAAFEEWQNVVPEICWIEDFNRKYFRPNNVYDDDSYLKRLANGKKTHQRKQYEVYQDQYMNSQYKTNTGEGSLIQWRSRQPQNESIMVDGKYEIKGKVKMYADGYFTAAIASGAGEPDAVNIHIRGKKGQEIEFSKAQGSPFDDATCYVYSPNLYQEFINTEGLYPEYITAIAANKLRKITFIPQNDIQKRMLKTSLSFGSNVEEVVFKDCQSVEESMIGLDLSNCGRLRKLDTTGSDLFTSYTIADGAPIEEIKIHKPTALILSNLTILDNEENFEIENYDRLRKVEIDNIDQSAGLSSKDIVENIYDNDRNANIEYDLENVIWTFDETDNITDSNIPLLDYLLQKGATIGKKKRELSLTGKANIPSSAYSGSNTLGLYEKYGLKSENDNTYPNLVLNFIDDNNQQKLYTISIKDGDGVVKWSRKYNSFTSLSNQDLEESAQGSFNASEVVKKQASPTQVFEFNNRWKYYLTNDSEQTIIGYIQGEDILTQYLDLSQLSEVSLADITIEPDYTYNTRYYTINFLDKDTESIFYTIEAEYDTKFDKVRPIVIPTKDDSLLSLTQTYRLKGYSAAKTSNTLINEEYWRVTDNTNLYSVFEEVSVYDIDYSKYLNIRTSINDNNRVEVFGLARTEPLPDAPNGKIIYNGSKIVLPPNVNYIGDSAFQSNTTLKKIFTYPGTVIERIGAYAFKDSRLEYFDFTNSIVKSIESDGFMNCSLKAKDYDYRCELSYGLIKLGQSAFNGGGNHSNMFADTSPMTIVIPAFITSEIKRAFMIGFLLYIPFLLIDIIVSSTLMSMGMVMLPPATIALPFKIMLFVLVDGWSLLIQSLITGFRQGYLLNKLKTAKNSKGA